MPARCAPATRPRHTDRPPSLHVRGDVHPPEQLAARHRAHGGPLPGVHAQRLWHGVRQQHGLLRGAQGGERGGHRPAHARALLGRARPLRA
eukprot:1181614-Pyramimonas_sp.AAC.1